MSRFAVISCMLFAWALEAVAAPPSPYVRLASPMGCSGTVIHSSRKYGVFVATASHCVRSGLPVTILFFKDGKSAQTEGKVVRVHQSADAAIVWVDPDVFWEMPLSHPLNSEPLSVDQVVEAVGSHAGGGTIHPAKRTVRVVDVRDEGRQISLADGAWSGHSGGGIVDRDTHRLVGVLWGTTTDGWGRRTPTGLAYSYKVFWEMMYDEELD